LLNFVPKNARFIYIVITDNIISISDNNMLTNCEQKIMEVMLPQIYKAYSVRALSKLIGSSYALTYDSAMSLKSKKMIKAEKMGNTLACTLNLSADPQMLAISSLTYSKNLLDKSPFGFIIDEIKNKLTNMIYIIALFGSYAKGSSTKKSDIDLLFVVQNESDIEKIKSNVNSVLSSTNLKVEFDVVAVEWLVEMFSEKNTVGREILEASVILHGAEQYYTLVHDYDKKRGH